MQTMLSLSALDLVPVLSTKSIDDLVDAPTGLAQSAFALVCATEIFEQLVSERYGDLAEKLCNAANNLFKSTSDSLALNQDMVQNPEEKYRAFERFEKVFLCLNVFYTEIADSDWRAQIAWRNIQDSTKFMKRVLIMAAA